MPAFVRTLPRADEALDLDFLFAALSGHGLVSRIADAREFARQRQVLLLRGDPTATVEVSPRSETRSDQVRRAKRASTGIACPCWSHESGRRCSGSAALSGTPTTWPTSRATWWTRRRSRRRCPTILSPESDGDTEDGDDDDDATTLPEAQERPRGGGVLGRSRLDGLRGEPPEVPLKVTAGLRRRVVARAKARQAVVLRLEPGQIAAVRRLALRRRIPYQTVLRTWISEGIARAKTG